jgi:large subunit ribosomal protein L9
MEVILIQDVNNLGGANELVKVKNGYARNRAQLVERQKQIAKKEAALLAEVNNVIAKLKESTLKIGAKTGTSGKIFGSVNNVQIARAIREQKGYEIDRRRISILDEVKEIGLHKAKIDFGSGNETELEFEVVAE